MADVFLSYSHRDSQIAWRLWRQLREAGVDTFWDRDIPAGLPVREAVSEAIAAAKIFVLLHPGHHGSSDFIGLETQAAITRSLAGDLRLIPVLLPGRPPIDDIGAFQYVGADSEHDFKYVVQLIVDALGAPARAHPSDRDRRQSLLRSLLESDLGKAPQAAALVLDEIASSFETDPSGDGEEFDLLYRATQWAEQHLGIRHRSHVSLRYQLSAALLHAGRYEESIGLSRRILENATTEREKLEVGVNLGYALFQIGSLDAASDQYQTVMYMAQRNDSPSVLTTCLVALGSIARAYGDYARAEHYYERALEVSAHFVQSSARIGALIGLSEIAAQTGDTEAERRWADEAVWLSRTTLPANDALALRAAALRGAEDVK